MKTKNILMSVLLVMGFIAAKAATGYPPELALVSQPVMVYNYNSITVYYDVQNIGDYTYRGHVYIYLDPDNGYHYADKYVRVRPGRIKRIAIEIPAYRPNPACVYTIMPYYELGNELYSFTTFEYMEPLSFYWNGSRTECWVVMSAPVRVYHYVRPGDYRFYYDGFRPPMPPPTAMGYGPATPPPPMDPMDPMHHTYSYHHNNGGYPTHHEWNDNPPAPNSGGGNNGNSGDATVRPKANAGSMSHSNSNPPATPGSLSNGSNSGSSNGRTGNSGTVNRPSNNGVSTGSATGSSSSGRTGNSGKVSRPSSNSSTNNSGNVSRPSNNSGSNSGRTGNSNVSRPSGNSSSSTSSATGSSLSGRSGNSSTRSSSSSSNRSNNNSGRGSR